ncbi:hypothetical protein C9426_07065 [Serratia sp. S1B]|nr:hypothetical protein C9426_07065 [Serratia sp. S1B]
MRKIIAVVILSLCSVSVFAGQTSLKMHDKAAMDQKMDEFRNQYMQRKNALLQSIDPHATSLTVQQKQQMCQSMQIYFNNVYELMDQNRNLLKLEKREFMREQFKAMFLTRAGLSLKQINCNFI